MFKLPRRKIKQHHIFICQNMMTDQFECAVVTKFRDRRILLYLIISIGISKYVYTYNVLCMFYSLC